MSHTAEPIMRRDKESGTTYPVSRECAIERLSGHYANPASVLDDATEDAPAQTTFALYWPAAS